MDNNGRMKVKNLALELNQDVKIIRQKLTTMGYKTFSDESEVSGEACQKMRELIKHETSKGPVAGGQIMAGQIRKVVRKEATEEKPAEKKETEKPEQKEASAAVEEQKPKVRRKPAESNEEKPAENKEEPNKKETDSAKENGAEEVKPKKKAQPKTEKKEEAKPEEEKTNKKAAVKKTTKEESAEKKPQEEKPQEEKKSEDKPKTEAPKADTPKVDVAPVKKGRSAGIASSNESFKFDLGGSSVSKQREEFAKARQEFLAQRPRVRRESATDNAFTRREERKNQENQNRFSGNRNGNGNGYGNGNRYGEQRNNYGNRPQGGFNNFDKGAFDKDGDGDDRQRRTQSPNKTQGQKPVEHVEQGLEQRREKTGDKDSSKKDKRMEGTRRTNGVGPISKEGKYNSARQFIGGKMDVSEVESDEFNYSGSFDVNDRVNRKANKKKDKEAEAARIEAQKLTKVKIPPTITVKNFAELIKKTGAEVVKKLFSLGIMATMNQEIDFDTACLIANEFGIEAEAEIVISDEEILLEDPEDIEVAEDACERPPVVVVMGHVDHGKTSLLDAIRNTSVTSGEAGGITQHIGAYTVTINDHKITFLDTPGHEAFTAMRARGAQVTDVAIIVVAADDGVMPQTIEAINHAKAANVSIVVAVNKIDKEGANVDRVMTEMAEQGIVCEEWGGDVPFVQVSAKKGLNIDTLLETVILSADILQLTASPTKQCKGTVIEAKLDKNKGPIATLLVQRGTLRSGDAILTESTFGHIRTMTNDKGRTIKEAGPSTPVEITGLPEVPEAGKVFYVVNKDEKLAKKVAEDRMNKARQSTMTYSGKVTLEGLFSQMQAGEVKDLNIIVKADVKGSAEAIKASLEKLSNEEVRVCVIHNAVGGVSESDVLLAEASNAVIIGFNVRPIGGVYEMAQEKGVDLKLYRVIYDAIDDVKSAMVGMLKPEFKESIIGHVEIRQTFKISGVGTIAGGYVLDGKVVRNSKARIVRDSIVIYEGNLASLKRFKDDAKEVAAGYECGLSFEKFDDLKEGDVIESYIMEEIQRTI